MTGQPFELRARIRQIHGGATVTDPAAPDGIRQCSPDGTVVAYRDRWMCVLFDDAMTRPSDRYCEIHPADAAKYHRWIGEAGDLPAADVDLLADRLTAGEFNALIRW